MGTFSFDTTVLIRHLP